MFKLIRELVLELPSPDRVAASAVSKRVARLDHELWNHAMEDDAFEVAAARVTDEVLDGLWCMLGEESNVDVTFTGMNRRGFCGGRWSIYLRWCGSRCRLLVPGRPFVEDIAVALVFHVPGKDNEHLTACAKLITTYSGSVCVNI